MSTLKATTRQNKHRQRQRWEPWLACTNPARTALYLLTALQFADELGIPDNRLSNLGAQAQATPWTTNIPMLFPTDTYFPEINYESELTPPSGIFASEFEGKIQDGTVIVDRE